VRLIDNRDGLGRRLKYSVGCKLRTNYQTTAFQKNGSFLFMCVFFCLHFIVHNMFRPHSSFARELY